MYKLASCCLLLAGCWTAVFALPVPDSGDEPRRLPAPDGGVRPTLDKADRVSLLHGLLVALGAETGDGPRNADPDADTFNPRGIMRKVFSGQGPDAPPNPLWARIGKHDKRGHPSECFWKYCV